MNALVDALVMMFVAFWVIVLGAVCVIAAFVTLADPGMLRWVLAERARRHRLVQVCGHQDCVDGERRSARGTVGYARTQPIPASVANAVPVPSRSQGNPALDGPAAPAAPAQSAAPVAEPAAGPDAARWFGSYQREELLAEGGSGQVWRVLDSRTGQRVALKHLRPDLAHDADARAQLAREAARLAGIGSSHVIEVYEHGEIDGQPYLVMPLAENGDLAQLLYARPDGVGPAEAVGIVAQVADGLEAIHATGLAHRDLKPANVVLTPGERGPAPHCRLVDLGIAFPLSAPHPAAVDPVCGAGEGAAGEDGGELRLTPAGYRVGTPGYMAPELFSLAHPTGVASDVYALGVLAHQLLTGLTPFPGPGVAELAHQHRFHPAPAPSQVRGGLARFDPVLARALAKDPAQRHSSPAALAADLARAARTVGPGGDPAASSGRRPGRQQPSASDRRPALSA